LSPSFAFHVYVFYYYFFVGEDVYVYFYTIKEIQDAAHCPKSYRPSVIRSLNKIIKNSNFGL